jgi:3-oxoacyl-[acyl-carrier-protein] synthase III
MTPGWTRPGVVIAGTGRALPPALLTNADLERVMDTSDEWIVQRTGIRTRHRVAADGSESVTTLGVTALTQAIQAAGLQPRDLDLVVAATMTADMTCPPCACVLAERVGARGVPAWDLNGACCGFVFALNCVHDLIRAGTYRTIGLVGGDTLTTLMRYSTAGRGTAILFGDAAAAVILRADPNPDKGIIAQVMHSDGTGWKDIYIPRLPRDFPPGVTPDPAALNTVQMNGASVFKFAVSTFPRLIEETLDKARLRADDVDMYVCHQSNARILAAARERFGLPESRLYVNIDRVGNTVAASVPLCLDELVRAGRVRPGMRVMFLAFGGGLTWGSSLWQM